MTEQEKERYSRQIILPEIGEAGQQRLKDARVLMIGCGGLGCPVLQYLVAVGVGNVGMIDPDTVSESNLQRQILYNNEDVGRLKVEVAREKLLKQNPNITFSIYPERLDIGNALDIISKYDVVVDGTDNFPTRYLVSDACVMLNKPLVFGSIFKFEGQVSVFNYNDGPTYRCLYPEPPAPGDMPSCAEIGVLGILPGIIGLLQATEVVKIITGIGEVLSGKLLAYDALSMQFNTYLFRAIEKNKHIQALNEIAYQCNTFPEISCKDLKTKLEQKEDIQIIDVREPYEYQNRNIGGELIPLGTIPDNLHKISKDKMVVIMCQAGIRSKRAVDFLMENGYTNVFNLKEGIIGF